VATAVWDFRGGGHHQDLGAAALELPQPVAQLREISLSSGSGVGDDERQDDDLLAAELAEAA
jgi:hypothetical protein